MNWAIVAAALSAFNLIAIVLVVKRIDGRFDSAGIHWKNSSRLRNFGVRDSFPEAR
jgi:hypothetical protein